MANHRFPPIILPAVYSFAVNDNRIEQSTHVYIVDGVMTSPAGHILRQIDYDSQSTVAYKAEGRGGNGVYLVNTHYCDC